MLGSFLPIFENLLFKLQSFFSTKFDNSLSSCDFLIWLILLIRSKPSFEERKNDSKFVGEFHSVLNL